MAEHSPEEQDTGFLAHLGDGKGQFLQDHLLGVSRAAQKHSDKIGIATAGAAIGLLHDLGKYSRDFQRYLRKMGPNQDTEQQDLRRGSIDHSTAGAQTIWRTLKGQGPQEGIVGEILALCVASHHSGLIDCIGPDGTDKLTRRMQKVDLLSHHDEAWKNAEKLVRELHERHLQDPALVGSLRDAIARICRTEPNDTIRRFQVGLLARFLFSCLIDADRTDTGDSAKPATVALRQHGQYAEWPALAGLLEYHLRGLQGRSQVDGLRKQVSESCLSASVRPKGAFTLTVPTGGGKTLASMRFALNHAAKWNMDRVIYVSPYTSIIDQNARVARRILEPAGSSLFGSIVLEHHSNLTPLKQTWKSKILSENWDAPVVFTTGVQLLESLFGSGTRAVRRMHQMANAVLIFDEIQTLPVRCVHLFNNALNFLVEQCGSSVVLCTATQPLLHQVDAKKGAMRLGKNSEIIPDVSSLFGRLRRCETKDRRQPGGWGYAQAAELAVSETKRVGSCLVVVNTKREALSIFKECRAANDVPVFHLSTGMCPAHRLKILHCLKKRLAAGKAVICVSTQLIEAGVDISFGSAIRAVAGLDSIAQTSGRCNRHGEAELGRVHVINLVGEVPKALRDIRAAQEAGQRVLDENRGGGERGTLDPSDPKLMAQYFRYYFFDRRKNMDYPVRPEQAERDDTLLRMLAGNEFAVDRCQPPPPIYLRQAFMTASESFQAIEANTHGVIVPYMRKGRAVIAALCSAHEPQKQFPLLKLAQRFTVNVFPWVFDKLQSEGALHEIREGTGILCLNEKYYNSADYGLNVEGTEEMEFQDA